MGVVAMGRHGHNLEVARLGCGVVAGSCQKSNQNASLMGRAGVVQEVLQLMDRHRGDGVVQVNACMAFERLYMKGGASSEGMQVAANKAMEAHPSNTQIKRGAKRLLEVLSQPLPEPLRPQQAPPRQERQFSLWARAAGKDTREVKLHDWLVELDSVGFLMEYYDDLRQNF